MSVFPLTGFLFGCQTGTKEEIAVPEEKAMRRILAVVLLGMGGVIMAMASLEGTTPEIDPASVGSALALLAGTLLIMRGRRRK
jgi:hypothetical protein